MALPLSYTKTTKFFLFLFQNVKLSSVFNSGKQLKKLVSDEICVIFTTSAAHLNVRGREKKRQISESPLMVMMAGTIIIFLNALDDTNTFSSYRNILPGHIEITFPKGTKPAKHGPQAK